MLANDRCSAAVGNSAPLCAANSNDTAAVSVSNCREFDMPCPEDLAIDQEFGRVYVSSCSRPRLNILRNLADFGLPGGLLEFPNPFKPPSASLVNGAILTFSLTNLEAQAVNLTAHLRELGAFRPCGIDLLPIDTDRARLFVTDRPADGRARIVIFDVHRATGALAHPVFVEHPSLVRAPNDIAAVSTDAFYFTNSQGSRFYWQQMLESIVPVGFGSIVHCQLATEGPIFRVEDAFKHYPNGVAYATATKRLYVAASLAKKVMAYGVVGKADEPRLVLLDEIAVPVAADNLSWDVAANLWVSGSPDLTALTAYSTGVCDTCPSQVVRIVDPSGAARVELIFSDDGSRISAASVGAYHETAGRKQLVVGAPYQDRLLVVDL